MKKVVVLGAGVMGTALATILADKNDVNLWCTEYDKEDMEWLEQKREHPRLEASLPENIKIYHPEDLAKAMEDREIVVLAVSSAGVKPVTKRIKTFLSQAMILVNVAKGLIKEATNYLIIPEIIKKILPRIRIVDIAGPSIAKEVAERVPTEVTFASDPIDAAEICKDVFTTSTYKVKTSSDLIGVGLCTALKNVYAIPAGICDGMFPDKMNTKAAIITEGMAETARILAAKGGDPKTLLGPAGIGDLFVTSEKGRNRMFGSLLGEGLSTSDALKEMERRKKLVEGYPATKQVYELVKSLEEEDKLSIDELPLLREVYAILYENKRADEVIRDLWK